jgi:hypothetical protein
MTDATFVHDELGRLRALVDSLGETLDPSILIGGWATWMRIGGDAFFSKDIDLIINSPALRTTLRETLDDYSESRHHGGMKVRGTIDGIHIDAYVPHESELGTNLRLRVEVLAEHTDPESIQNWILLNGEAHTISKIAALLDRPESEKGRKDAHEVLAMLFPNRPSNMPEIDPAYAIRILFEATGGPMDDIPAHVERAFALLAEIGEINKKRRRELDTVAKTWVNEARDQLAALRRPVTAAGFAVQFGGTGVTQLRRKDSGEPGNPGKWSGTRKPEGDVGLSP